MKKARKLALIFLSTLTCATLYKPFTGMAATKDLSFNINKDYSSCLFTFDCEEAGTYSGTVTSPSGDTYTLESVDNDTLNVTIDRVKQGTWTAQITDDTKPEIGKVKISVSGAKSEDNKNESSVTNNQFKVGKDIAGLKYYFKDSDLVVEWADENVGSVSIKVIDIDTSEVIADKKVSDQEFTCQIPSETKNISLSIVPSSSQNITGAAQETILSCDNPKDATVTFPSKEYTNKDSVDVSVTLNKTYSIQALVNDTEVIKEENKNPGTYNYKIPVASDGENNIIVYIIDDSGNMTSYGDTIQKDTTPPAIAMNEEYDGMDTSKDTIALKGKISGYDTFQVNGDDVKVNDDGTFTCNCKLTVGLNTITMTATDIAGNEADYKFNITRNKTKASSPAPLLLIIIIIVLFLVFKPKKKRLDKTNNDLLKASGEQIQINETDQNITFGDKKVDLRKNKFNIDIESKISKESVTAFVKKYKSPLKLLCFILVLFFIFDHIIMVGTAISGSMEPTFMTKDYAIYNRLAYISSKPERGDIISFKHDGTVWCKRVVAVAGDKVSFHDGYVYINNKRDEELYLDDDVETNCTKEFNVPEGRVFVLGDNREYSYDSRYWDDPYVNIKDIVGKNILIIPSHTILNK